MTPRASRLLQNLPYTTAGRWYCRLKRTEIVERLNRLRRTGVFPGRQAWVGRRSWPDAALAEHGLRPFEAVLSTEPREAHNWVVVPNDLDPGQPCLAAAHEMRVERTAEAMAEALAPLLRASKVFIFVDPYFSPGKNRFLRPLRGWLGHIRRAERLEYHLLGELRGDPRPELGSFRRDLERRDLVPDHLTMTFLQWRERPGRERFHARYIITERAAVRFDNGLDDGSPGQTVPLTLLPYAEHQHWFRAFSETSDVFELLPPISTSQPAATSRSGRAP